jgi:TPR repeat protein
MVTTTRRFVFGFLVRTVAGISVTGCVLADDGPPTPQEMYGYGLYLATNASKGDKAALSTLEANSKLGDPGAEFGLGEYYSLTKDYAQAISWFQKSADHGFGGGYYALGIAADAGLGVPRDHAQAMRMYLKANDQLPSAGTNIALLYAGGCGVAQDYAQAAKWYRKAADAGDLEAAIYLGSLYLAGQSVPQDDAQAMHWYKKAADLRVALAEYRLGLLYEESKSLQDFAQAAYWYGLAGQQGVADAQRNLGVLLASGKGVAKDPARALNWFQMSANQGNGPAQFHLASSFANGEGTRPDQIRAYQWMTIAKASLTDKDPEYALAAKDLQSWEQQMTPTQVAQAKKAADQWLESHMTKKEQPMLRQAPCANPGNEKVW